MMIMILVVVCGPGPDCGADDDSVHLGTHSVLNIGRDQQVASDGITFCPGFVESIAEGYFQLALDNGNAGVLAVPMVLPISGGNEEGVRESFPGTLRSPSSTEYLVPSGSISCHTMLFASHACGACARAANPLKNSNAVRTANFMLPPQRTISGDCTSSRSMRRLAC